MSRGRGETEGAAPPARQPFKYHPLGLFLLGWIVTTALALGVLYVAGGSPRVKTAPAAGPAAGPRVRYSATATFALRQPADALAKLRDDLAGPDAVAKLPEDLELPGAAPRGADTRPAPAGGARRRRLVERLMDGITVDRQADLVSVTATHSDPATAQRIANTLVTNYIHRVSDRILSRLEADGQYMTARIAECEARLGALSKARRALEARRADARFDNLDGVKKHVGVLSAGILALQVRQAAAEANVAMLTRRLKPVMRPNPERARLVKQVVDAEKKLKIEHKGKTDRHPKIVSLKARIDSLARRISEMPEQVRVPSESERRALLARKAAAEADLAAVTDDKEQLEKRREPLEKLLESFEQLGRQEAEVAENIAKEQDQSDTWAKRRQAVQADRATELARRRKHLSTVQAAAKPAEPDPVEPAEKPAAPLVEKPAAPPIEKPAAPLVGASSPPPVEEPAPALGTEADPAPVGGIDRLGKAGRPAYPLGVMLAIAAAIGLVGGITLVLFGLRLHRVRHSTPTPSH